MTIIGLVQLRAMMQARFQFQWAAHKGVHFQPKLISMVIGNDVVPEVFLSEVYAVFNGTLSYLDNVAIKKEKQVMLAIC